MPAEFLGLIQDTGRGFVITIPSFPGIVAHGETEDLARANARRLVLTKLKPPAQELSLLPGRLVNIEL